MFTKHFILRQLCIFHGTVKIQDIPWTRALKIFFLFLSGYDIVAVDLGENGNREIPERTHWRPSKKLDIARIGIMPATYSTSCVSSLYA